MTETETEDLPQDKELTAGEQAVLRGLRDAMEGRTYSLEEVRERHGRG